MLTFTNFFNNLFLQSNCPLCDRSTPAEFCPGCIKQLQKSQLAKPAIGWGGEIPVFAWGSYGGSLKRAIGVMKYQKQSQIARPLGRWLGESWLLYSPLMPLQLIAVPIPLHPNREKERGFNQATLIAKSFCETTGLKFKPNGLQRIKNTEAQYQVSQDKRDKNLSDAFSIGTDFRNLPKIPVLLVDDIYTTGATAKSAIKTLNQAGISVVGIVTVATGNSDKYTKNSWASQG
jgi:ComF family protein